MSQLPLPVKSPETDVCPVPEYAWRFSFDDFVVGPCNELAHAAARSMCGGGGGGPDILFLSSAPGLGKTHLIQAVGKALCESCNRKTPKVEYLTAEEFASRFYLSLKLQDTDRFKARYRDLDLLLLEDMHFFFCLEKMQAELLATIKSLQGRAGKIILTSSFGPRDLRQMDEQLQSRLCAGLLSFIDRPDEQTRRRILRHKATIHQVLLPGDVEDILIRHIQADIRLIESCLQNLILKARILRTGITAQMAWEVIANYAVYLPVLDVEAIIRQVCRGFGLTREQLVSASRKQEYVAARNTAFYLTRKHTDLSLTAIGQLFNRKHTTVIKGITSLERELSSETSLGRQIANAITMIERNGNIAASAQ
jgi:chromosomal replication initiator protein